jgi:hypothetical protein
LWPGSLRMPLLWPPLVSTKVTALGLAGMARALDEQRRAGPTFEALGFEERLGLLVDREAAERDTKRLTARLTFAALRQTASIEDLVRHGMKRSRSAVSVPMGAQIPSVVTSAALARNSAGICAL